MALFVLLVSLLVWVCVKFWVSKSPRWLAIVWILPLNIICALVFWFLYGLLLESGFGAQFNHMDVVRTMVHCLAVAVFFTPLFIHLELRKRSKRTSNNFLVDD